MWFNSIVTSQISSPSASVDTQLHICTSMMTQDVLAMLTGRSKSSLSLYSPQNERGEDLSLQLHQAERKTFRFVPPICHHVLRYLHHCKMETSFEVSKQDIIIPAFERRQILTDILSFLTHLTTTIEDALNSLTRPTSSNAFVVSAAIAARRMVARITKELSMNQEDTLSKTDKTQLKRLSGYGKKLEMTVSEQLENMKSSYIPMHFLLTRLEEDSDIFFFQDRDSLNRVLRVCSERLLESQDEDSLMSGAFSGQENGNGHEEDENDFDVRTLVRRDTSASSKTEDDDSEIFTRECASVLKDEDINITCLHFISHLVSNAHVHKEKIDYVRDAILKLHESSEMSDLSLETTNTFLSYFSGLCALKPGSKICVEAFEMLIEVVNSGLNKMSSSFEFCEFLLALHDFCCRLPSPDMTSWSDDKEEKEWMRIETEMASKVETWLIRIGSNASSWYVDSRLSLLFLSIDSSYFSRLIPLTSLD